jgi:hypothetical protein
VCLVLTQALIGFDKVWFEVGGYVHTAEQAETQESEAC